MCVEKEGGQGEGLEWEGQGAGEKWEGQGAGEKGQAKQKISVWRMRLRMESESCKGSEGPRGFLRPQAG